jgi:hypothetical protein
MRGHIIFESVLSLHLVQPLLPRGIVGLQSAFHLSQCRAIALTLACTVGDFLHWLLPISNTKTQMWYVLKFYLDFPCEWRIYNMTAHLKRERDDTVAICDLQHSQSFSRSDGVHSGIGTNVWRNLPSLWADGGSRFLENTDTHWPKYSLTPVESNLMY